MSVSNFNTFFIFILLYFLLFGIILSVAYATGNRVQTMGVVDLHSYGMEVMSMKNFLDFKDLMSFGLFLLALLTFIYNICK